MGAYEALDKLAKWRKFFAGWQLGTRLDSDGESRAVRDHREVSIVMRAELSALVGLLIKKGVFNDRQWAAALERQAQELDHDYERRFPGWSATPEGLLMKMPEAGETMRQLGFPP